MPRSVSQMQDANTRQTVPSDFENRLGFLIAINRALLQASISAHCEMTITSASACISDSTEPQQKAHTLFSVEMSLPFRDKDQTPPTASLSQISQASIVYITPPQYKRAHMSTPNTCMADSVFKREGWQGLLFLFNLDSLELISPCWFSICKALFGQLQIR
jgi:hypothetical protein